MGALADMMRRLADEEDQQALSSAFDTQDPEGGDLLEPLPPKPKRVEVTVGAPRIVSRTTSDGSRTDYPTADEAGPDPYGDMSEEELAELQRSVRRPAESADSRVAVTGDRIEAEPSAAPGPEEKMKAALALAQQEAQRRREQAIANEFMGSDTYMSFLRGSAPQTGARVSTLQREGIGAPVEDAKGQIALEQYGQGRADKEAERMAAAEGLALKMKAEAGDKQAARALQERQLEEQIRHNKASEAQAAKPKGGGAKKPEKPPPVVPGMDVTPGARPTDDDAKKVKASLAAAERMRAYVRELRDLHKQHGTEYGGAGNKMQMLTEQIRIEGKNIAELGALSGPDMEIMQRLARADPGGLGANLKAIFGVDDTQSALDGLERWVNDQVSGTSKAYGYQPKPGAAPETPPIPQGGGLPPDKRARLEELRAKRATGTLR